MPCLRELGYESRATSCHRRPGEPFQIQPAGLFGASFLPLAPAENEQESGGVSSRRASCDRVVEPALRRSHWQLGSRRNISRSGSRFLRSARLGARRRLDILGGSRLEIGLGILRLLYRQTRRKNRALARGRGRFFRRRRFGDVSSSSAPRSGARRVRPRPRRRRHLNVTVSARSRPRLDRWGWERVRAPPGSHGDRQVRG